MAVRNFGFSFPFVKNPPICMTFLSPCLCKNTIVDTISTKITLMHNECRRKHPNDSESYFLDCKFSYHILGTNYKCKDVPSREMLGMLCALCRVFPPSACHRNQTALQTIQLRVVFIHSPKHGSLTNDRLNFIPTLEKCGIVFNMIDRKFILSLSLFFSNQQFPCYINIRISHS